ncbi:regulator of G-protein signaling 7 isoform X4 [Tribolium castaneum]|uniref:regulator of G-protein signaling 7 isoform X4 n=1 Tax=Tribolium castaneum TaxID=7070 RepID=UPI00077DBA29|nr:PREDICTED: regulator of G-protein signaling 7 isoform X3 [Tribolium castaneum]|eukprot:XP_015838971.1 PREDICTED: regulator of G-protein signaling 7 isoform X3 [Tribolium castaneum]
MEPDHRDHRCHRPSAFDKMEGLVREMQDTEHGGVPVRSQKLFLTSIPAAFMGYDLIEWLMERLGIEESEALNLANQLCQYGYFFPVSDSKNLVVKDDSSLYRFQSPYYWPWQNRPPDNIEYAIYLAKRTLRNKQRHGLEDYELEALSNLRKNLANKWDFITMQAEEQVCGVKFARPGKSGGLQVKLSKVLKKGDKIISDSQERAYWRVHRPPPGMVTSLEQCPVPTRSWNGSRTRKRTIEDGRREVELLKNSLSRTRVKVSQALESMVQHVETYAEYDPLITPTQPSNPWVSEDTTYWQLNSPLVEVPTEKRVRRWGLSMEELVSDPTGLQEFTNYLRKEYSHENIRFWMAVNDLRRSAQSQIQRKVNEIFEEFLAPGAPCEINIDGKTMEKVHQEMKTPSRFTFDAAQEHVYTLLLKKDCYPRFIRSEYYKNLLATGIQPSQKKRFFGFGQTKKKTSTSSAPNQQLLQQQPSQGASVTCGALSKRRGSDRSLSGSAHELAVSGVKDSKVPHSHSQSNLSDIPYRVKKPSIAIVAGASTSEEVCPWESGEPRSRKNSAQLDSGSSSSDISVAVAEVSERVQRVCTLTQQHTVDGSRKLSTSTMDPPRRASVSVPITHSTTGDSSKRKVSSFEDNSSAATSTSSSVFVIPSDTDNKSEECTSTNKTVVKNHGLAKACSVTGANAPIISVSSVADDLPPDSKEEQVEPTTSQEPLAPLAEPDSESPASELPPSEPITEVEADTEAKSNDVCPWEDEETCKVDTPFVKTYATLGYL